VINDTHARIGYPVRVLPQAIVDIAESVAQATDGDELIEIDPADMHTLNEVFGPKDPA
jgi:hypothetical protein